MNRTFLPTPDRPGRVLIVDDDPNDLRLFEAQLEGHPFLLTLAGSATEALALVEKIPFEGILSDVLMPGMDGMAFCRALRGSMNELTPFMFISGRPAGNAWTDEGLEAGALDYLKKPYVVPELIAKLRVMVRLSRQQAALSASERQDALLEVTGGAAHELSQPLAAARLHLDRLERQRTSPTVEQMSQLRDFVDRTASILNQLKGLRTYVTKPYLSGRIMDIEKSHEASGHHAAFEPAKPEGKE